MWSSDSQKKKKKWKTGMHLKSHCAGEERIKHFQNKANETVDWNNISEGHFCQYSSEVMQTLFSQQTIDSI